MVNFEPLDGTYPPDVPDPIDSFVPLGAAEHLPTPTKVWVTLYNDRDQITSSPGVMPAAGGKIPITWQAPAATTITHAFLMDEHGTPLAEIPLTQGAISMAKGDHLKLDVELTV
jgi:hypothetical protein